MMTTGIDEETRQIVANMSAQLDLKYNYKIGEAVEDLEAEICREEECSLGNIVSDSFVSYFNNKLGRSKVKQLTTCQTCLSILNGGNIRSGIDKGNITYKVILEMICQ